MAYDQHGARYGSIAAEINRAFAVRHGLTFVLKTNASYFSNRHASWQKIGLLRETLSSGEFDAAIWVDADAVLLEENHHVLPELLRAERTQNKSILFSGDRLGYGVNAGVLIVRNTEVTRIFLEGMADGLDSNVDAKGGLAECTRGLPLTRDPHLSSHKCNASSWTARAEIICRQYFQIRNWEQTCIHTLWAVGAYGLRRHSKILPYGTLQTAAAPRDCLRPQAAVLHFMIGNAPDETRDGADREHGLRILQRRLLANESRTLPLENVTLVPERYPAAPPRHGRGPCQARARSPDETRQHAPTASSSVSKNGGTLKAAARFSADNV